jgi:hypothetical protein
MRQRFVVGHAGVTHAGITARSSMRTQIPTMHASRGRAAAEIVIRSMRYVQQWMNRGK